MERWWYDTDRGTELWSVGGMILSGNRSVERWWNDTERGTEAWSVGGMILTGE